MLHCLTKRGWEKLKIRGEWMIRFLSRRRGLLLRGLLCWLIGCLALSVDEVNSYDLRYNLRGEQSARPEIVILTVHQSDLARSSDVRANAFANLNEITDLTDSLFWDQKTWVRAMRKILAQSPRAVGITLWFGDNIGAPRLSSEDSKVLQDPRLFWSTSTNNLESMMTPAFALSDLSNIGSNDLRRDEDGVVRRVFPGRGEVPHLIERVTGVNFPKSQAGLVINYRGSPHVFSQYSMGELLNDEIPPGLLKGRIVLIGSDGGSGSRFISPVGPLNRVEILAHVLDNHIAKRWIARLPFVGYALIFLALTILSVFLITAYPQSVVLLFFWWIGTLCTALSTWAFDTWALWFPALSPFALLAATWIIFIGYQATKIERLNFRLQQERLYLQELEQLKNNFVSLISHDLKTPIAKIQAVLGRMRSQPVEGELAEDLKTLHDSSEELNRYIQSILKVLRVESRDFKLHREVADMNEIIAEVVQRLRPLADEKNIEIETRLEPMFSAEFDVTLMKEVVINIVENAIKYTPADGRVIISSQEIDDEIRVRVQDTGQGIAPEELDKIWQKFVRGKDQDLKTKGTGLGLYLVKYFIELHDGRVRLESELGKGSTVSFTLPVSDVTKVEPNNEVMT